MHKSSMALICALLFPASALSQLKGKSDEGDAVALRRDFIERVAPLIQNHCSECHSSENPEAQLDLSRFKAVDDVITSHAIWDTVMDRVAAGEMPPDDGGGRLSDDQRHAIVTWIQALRQFEAERNAGDPGVVLAHRLSNSEYDNSIRDLTGVDIRPTQTFPIDPASESGFDNSGESLTMSPALLKKYLEAARTVSDHLVFTPYGLDFAPHPVTTDTDRDKYCVKRIVEFYYRQPTDYADYFFAAWLFRHLTSLENESVSLDDVAREQGVSPKYLRLIWKTLSQTDAPIEIGPLGSLREMWRELPVSSIGHPETLSKARQQCSNMRDFVLTIRKELEPRFENLQIREVHNGTQPFVLWKNKQYANHRRAADLSRLGTSESTLAIPEGVSGEDFAIACQEFCSVFPDAFYVSERGRDYLGTPKEKQEKGRLLSAGFHSMTGYFRDDKPLMQLLLSEQQQRELDQLWQELDFFASAPQRQYQGFLWFDRTDSRFMRDPQFDFARPENKASLESPLIEKLGERYVAKAAANNGGEVALRAIRDYFIEINSQIRWVENARAAAEPVHLDSIIAIAARAFRRPLSATQEQELRDLYRELREHDDLTHEEAIQDTLVTILMSPNFCYRHDLLSRSVQPQPLDDFELASRLSYFVWASTPDAELLRLAAAGTLKQPEVLQSQTQRMLRDRRVRGLATEFGGNWLDFRRFEQHNSVDRRRFPTFDDQLRAAMFEEPVRFLQDIIQRDRSILDCLYSNRTFVNQPLAEHYGLDVNQIPSLDESWQEIPDASPYGRGGLLPMAVFLTKNAPGLRTSPVKRGYWVVRRLLGERIPPPPPNVPELPTDESQLGELTLRETLAKHREHSSCAGCHDRFDSIGLVFEGFGPIGERRELDLGGRAVDTQAEFPDGSQRAGVEELRDYLREHRQAEFVDNLCRKLLSYALSRSLQLSDEGLVQAMKTNLETNDFQFGKLVETIVISPQFVTKRGRTDSNTASLP